jgi:hypothetical protein
LVCFVDLCAELLFADGRRKAEHGGY